MHPPGRLLLGVLLLLAAATTAADNKPQTWVEVRSPNFVVVCNGGEKKAREVAAHFEQIRAVYRASLPFAASHPSPPMTILAAKDEKSLRELLPEYWEKGHSHPAGMFIQSLNLYYILLRTDLSGPDPYHVIFHEYFHSLTLPYYPNLPLWLAEGLADFYANAEITSKDASLGMPNSSQLGLLNQEKLLPLAVLMRVDHSSPYYNEKNKAGIFYAESWALTHYLLLGDNQTHRKQLADFIAGITRGEPSDRAAAASFGDLVQLQKQLENYVHRYTFLKQVVNAPPTLNDKEFQSRTLSAAEADARIGEAFVCRQLPGEARPLIEEALRLEPNLALAHEAMGLLRLSQDDRASAVASFEEAIRLDPNNYLTHYYHAILSPWPLPGDTDPKIEADLQRAVKLNPDFAPAQEALARSEASANHDLPDAFEHAKKALQLVPGDIQTILTIARMLLQMGKTDDAIILARKAQSVGTDPSERAEIAAFLEVAEHFKNVKKDSNHEMAQAGDAGPSDKAVASAPPAPEAPAHLRIGAAGQIIASRCSGTAIDVTFKSGSGTFSLHAADSSKIGLAGAPASAAGAFDPCTQLEGHAAYITFVTGDDFSTGEIQRIKLAEPAATTGLAPGTKPLAPAENLDGGQRKLPASSNASVSGKISGVTCDGNEMQLTLQTSGGSLQLRSPKYRDIEFYSLHWKVPKSFDPCKQLTGLTAKVKYAVTPGKPYAGEILSLEVQGPN